MRNETSQKTCQNCKLNAFGIKAKGYIFGRIDQSSNILFSLFLSFFIHSLNKKKMKKLYTLMAISIANFSYAQIVDFESITLTPNSAWDGSDLSGTPNSGATLYDSTFVFSGLEITNQWSLQFGAPGYLSGGWVFSNIMDDVTPALAGAYHSYAGEGANGSDNYAITYIGTGQIIQLENNETATFASIDITNNNYAAHSMLNGDILAKKFGGTTGNDEDWFLLDIIGYDANGIVTDTIKFYLADYRFTDNSEDFIIKDWATVDLSSLGEINKIRFEQSSSDNSGGYMNTPSYLAIDNLSFGFTSVEESTSRSLSIYPNPSNSIITFNEVIEQGNLSIYSISGQNVISLNFNSTLRTFDLSELTNGIYTIIITDSKNRYTTKLIKN